MVNANLVAETVAHTLRHFPLAPAYTSEQRDLQPHVRAEIEEALASAFPGSRLVTTISVGGKGKPSLRLLGTSYWPDVVVADKESDLVAMEVKLIRTGQPTSKAIAEAVGQAIIYSVRYPRVFAFIVNYGRSDINLHDEDTALIHRLSPLSVDLIVRTSAGSTDAVVD